MDRNRKILQYRIRFGCVDIDLVSWTQKFHNTSLHAHETKHYSQPVSKHITTRNFWISDFKPTIKFAKTFWNSIQNFKTSQLLHTKQQPCRGCIIVCRNVWPKKAIAANHDLVDHQPTLNFARLIKSPSWGCIKWLIN